MSINTITSTTTRGVYMSRHAMLKWVNNLVKGQFTKIEDFRSGVAYCRMMYMIYPESINMKHVKIAPRLEHEYVHNLRLLQTVFNRLAIGKLVPIESLIQGRFKHNFEFMQWFIKFYDSVMSSQTEKPKIKPRKLVSISSKSKMMTKKPKQDLAITPITESSQSQVSIKKEEQIPVAESSQSQDSIKKEEPIPVTESSQSQVSIKKEEPIPVAESSQSHDSIEKEEPIPVTESSQSQDSIEKEEPIPVTESSQSQDSVEKEEPIPVTVRSQSQDSIKKEEPIPEPQVNDIKEDPIPVEERVWDPFANWPMGPYIKEVIRSRDKAYHKLFVIEQMLATVNDESPVAGLTKRINAVLSAPMDGEPPIETTNDDLHEASIDTS